MKSLAYLNKYLYKYRLKLLLGVGFVVLSNIFNIVPARLVRESINLVIGELSVFETLEGDAAEAFRANFYLTLLTYAGLILGMALLRGVFLFMMRQTVIVVSRRIEYDLKNEVYRHYQSLPLQFYRKNNTGDLMNRISEDVSRVRMYLGPGIMYSINLLVTFLVVVGYMLTVNAALTLFALLPLPLLSLSIYFVSRTINRRAERIQKSLSDLSTFVQEAFSGIRVLKSFVKTPQSSAEFVAQSNKYKQHSLNLTKVDALFFPLILGLIGLSTILTVFVGGNLVIAGKITPGNIAEFILYVNMLTWPVTSLGWVTSLIQRAEASQKRINEFLEVKSTLTSTQNLKTKIEGEITFDKVSFTYPNAPTKALDKISFTLKKGETLAVLGTTGSGKSTLADLLMRLFDTTEGTIKIDQKPLKSYHLRHLREQMGYVPQDVFLFSDTIGKNIAFGEKNAEKAQIVQAAKDAGLYENILRLEKGLETRIGERGVTLSGGQKQRTSIARALIRKPAILILDDCLSAVDTKTENRILNNLAKIMENRTALIISHRISSAKIADKIIVLDQGKIIQQGTHKELLAQEGAYKTLYEKQLKKTQNN